MARVRGVMAASILVSSMFWVSGRMSTNTGVAPWLTNALAVDTNVYDGIITSTSGPDPMHTEHISSAAVPELTSSAFFTPSSASSRDWHSGPYLQCVWICLPANKALMLSSSPAPKYGLLLGISLCTGSLNGAVAIQKWNSCSIFAHSHPHLSYSLLAPKFVVCVATVHLATPCFWAHSYAPRMSSIPTPLRRCDGSTARRTICIASPLMRTATIPSTTGASS
mmetsp:Transcript_30419/g.71048  ORF Transcript_30419/g.71048 Transcript_30419/m.71048 type:complete len:223 (+) Transcript_30419:1284-1952(+)